jgi:glycosyltransferase involved in cell wall biosynthesis
MRFEGTAKSRTSTLESEVTIPDPLVTVVIPVFNRSHTVETCVESVQRQTFPDLEIVTVDDGSTDNTLDVLQRLAKTDKRIRTLSIVENRGAQAGRNLGIRYAHGSWIAFLDSDDEYLPDSISSRLKLARMAGVDAVTSDCLIKHADGRMERFSLPKQDEDFHRQFLADQGPMFQSLLVKRNSLLEIGLLDESIVSYQEWDTVIRLAECASFAALPEPTFIYSRSTPNAISSDLLRDAHGYEQVVRKHRKAIAKKLGFRKLAEHYFGISHRYRTSGHMWRAVQNWVLGSVLCLSPRTSYHQLTRLIAKR